MLWLIVIISAYFLQAIAALVDKYLLKSHIPSAKVYAFYVGIFSIAALAFIPLGFYIPSLELIVLDILAGAFLLFGLYVFYSALSKFEVSRIIPAIGGITPLFVFTLVYLLSEDKLAMGIHQVISFVLLLLGSILIVYNKDKLITFKSFQFSALAAFLFSISSIFRFSRVSVFHILCSF
jgi:drug/metabolite transporter superfamily protein YnfA